MKTLLLILLPFLCLSQTGIGTSNPHQSAILDVTSTTKGVLVPRMDSTQMINITNPATGLLIFNTTTETFYYKNSVKWIELLPTIQATGCNTGIPKNYDICIDSTGNKYTFYIYFNTKWTKL